MMQRLCKFIFSYCVVLSSSYGYAEFSSNQRIHSLFNSELLQEDEFLFDLVPFGSAQYGLTKNLELGTSSFSLIIAKPSLFLKHRMFTVGKTETSFSSFTIFFPKTGIDNNVVASGVFSLHGIVTSYRPTSKFYLNAGLMRAYALMDSSDKSSSLGDIHSSAQYDIYGALVGLEYYPSSKWGMRSFLLLPVYMDASIVGDTGDANASVVGNFKLFEQVYAANISMTRSWNIFNFEFGLFLAGKITIPYLSLLWRTK